MALWRQLAWDEEKDTTSEMLGYKMIKACWWTSLDRLHVFQVGMCINGRSDGVGQMGEYVWGKVWNVLVSRCVCDIQIVLSRKQFSMLVWRSRKSLLCFTHTKFKNHYFINDSNSLEVFQVTQRRYSSGDKKQMLKKHIHLVEGWRKLCL